VVFDADPWRNSLRQWLTGPHKKMWREFRPAEDGGTSLPYWTRGAAEQMPAMPASVVRSYSGASRTACHT